MILNTNFLVVMFSAWLMISPLGIRQTNHYNMQEMAKAKYGYYGRLQAKKGQGSALAEILLEAAMVVAELKGCHTYLVSQDLTDPDLIRITEIWDSKEDQLASLQSEEVRQLIARAIPLMTEEQERGKEMTILGGVAKGF